MNKKTLFLTGWLSTTAVAIPLIAVTSCATINEGTIFLTIASKESVLGKINPDELTTNPISQQTLEKVFNGITKDNINQFTSAWDQASKKITLTTKEGYKFGNETSPQDKIQSVEIIPTIILNISQNKNVHNNGITKAEIDAQPIAKTTLIKAFDGITDENINGFTAVAQLVPDNTNLYFILLTVKDGYGFGDQMDILTSLTFTI
ncbi:MAG: hypothetical protein ACRDA7_02960 [Metamycoplasmataceae bacterium]